jgi:hypothetical protein
MNWHSWPGGMLARAAVILLLIVAVPALSTLAKDGQNFARTSPAGHVSLSTKMNVAHAPVVASGDTMERVASAEPAPPPPPVWLAHLQQFKVGPALDIGITLSMQHRFPPSLA